MLMRGLKNQREIAAADVVGVADRRGQQFGRHVDRRALVVNLVVGEDADPYFVEEVGVGGRSRADDRQAAASCCRCRGWTCQRPPQARSRAQPTRVRKNGRWPPARAQHLDSAPRVYLNRGARGSGNHGRPCFGPGRKSEECGARDIPERSAPFRRVFGVLPAEIPLS